ncbi:hypothetical protein ABPG75_013768 [Micractinium tetrahymenae]
MQGFSLAARPLGRLALVARPARLPVLPARPAALARSAEPARRPLSAPLATAASGGATPVSGGNATDQLQDAFGQLAGTQVVLVSTQQPVDITSLWSEDERCVLAFGRHMLARQLARDVLPALDARNIKLFYTTIGTPQKGVEFATQTGFPAHRLLADERSVCYEALAFRKGLRATFFDAATPAAIRKRQHEGADQDLKEVLRTYKPLMPPKMDQAFWQGGVLVFEGRRLLWAHADPATSAHADLEEVVAAATAGL